MIRNRKPKKLLAAALTAVLTCSFLPVLPMGSAYAAGGITQDYWNGATGGNVSQIPLGKTPTGTKTLALFESPKNIGDNYGTKTYGFLTPPTSGAYTFWVAGDDSAELWLSPDSDPGHKEKIAYNTSWAGPRDFDKYPTQKSIEIPLKAGKLYYIEGLHKEAGYGDNMSVAWQGPGIPREVIPGAYLTPYQLPAAPTGPVHNDEADTFGWTPVPGYESTTLYEYSDDRGRSWKPADANPVQLDNLNYTKGQIQVRLKETSTAPAGQPLSSVDFYRIKMAPKTEYPKTVLWQLGLDDQNSAEFSDYKTAKPENVAVPADWSTRTDWSQVSKGVSMTKNGAVVVSYSLDAVPEHGVEFSFRSLDAYVSVPQLAVFSNDTMAGLIQIVGLNGGNTNRKYKETYRLYIPKEMLKTGTNELKLEMDRGLYAGPGGDSYLWFEWDFAKLEALGGPAQEPIHGRYTRLGTSLVPHVLKDLDIQNVDVAKWLGLAYSGNVIRSGQNSREWLLALRDLNLAPVNIPFGTYIDDATLRTGVVPESVKTYYKKLIEDHGDLFEFLEIDNEPGVFDNAFLADLALATYLKETKAELLPWLTTVAPGWAYWPSKGTPDGWERDPAYRRQIEDLVDMTNGHSYSLSGIAGGEGGALNETMKTYPEYTGDGVARPMMLSETGANDLHTDNSRYDSYANRYSSIFDREMRSDVGYVDYIMQHAAYFREYSILKDNIVMKTAEDAEAYINPNQPGETRLDTFRRLALAYATHGKPLAYTYMNAAELAGKKAYFRAVDTSALGVTHTGAKSDKLLLNFVNFETTPVTMEVKVTMPAAGAYAGERFGAGDKYADSRSFVTLNASPELTLTETLQPGESIQYILNAKEDEAPTKPLVEARAVSYKQINIDWQPSSDNHDIAGYKLYDHGELIAKMPKAMTRYTHQDQRPESSHRYRVVAYDFSGNESEPSDEIIISSQRLAASPYTATTVNGVTYLKYEAEKTELIGVTNHGSTVGMYYTQGRLNLLDVPLKGDTDHVLKVRYSAAGNKSVHLLINNVPYRALELPGLEPGNTLELEFNFRTPSDTNDLILTIAKGADNVSASYDWFEIREGSVLEVPQPVWTTVTHKSTNAYYSSDTFAAGANGTDLHETSTPGDFTAIGFKGTGVRWISDVESYLGIAEVYIDDVLAGTVDLRSAGTQGTKKVVFEKTGLAEANHIVKVVALSGRIIHHGFQFLGTERMPFTPGADLIVTGVGIEPDAVYTGKSGYRFYLDVKNIGLKPTPAGIVTGAVFSLNGGAIGHTDYFKDSIAIGQTVRLYSSGGSGLENGTWTAPKEEKAYTLSVYVNDINRYPEMDKSNNRLSSGFTVQKLPDTEPPVTTAEGPAGWQREPVTVAFTAEDLQSGVKETYFKLDDGAFSAGSSVTVSVYGTHTVTYYSVDHAGNAEEPKSVAVSYDPLPPDIRVDGSLEIYLTDPVRLEVAATDSLSGAASLSVTLDGQDVSASIALDPLSLSLGDHLLRVTAADAAGNTAEQIYTVRILMDAEHVDDLIAIGAARGAYKNGGVQASLESKAMELKPLINHVEAQKGKGIEDVFAELLLGVLRALQ